MSLSPSVPILSQVMITLATMLLCYI